MAYPDSRPPADAVAEQLPDLSDNYRTSAAGLRHLADAAFQAVSELNVEGLRLAAATGQYFDNAAPDLEATPVVSEVRDALGYAQEKSTAIVNMLSGSLQL